MLIWIERGRETIDGLFRDVGRPKNERDPFARVPLLFE